MSRYTEAVESMDRRHRMMVRGASLIGAALVIGIALWSADVRFGNFDLAQWRQGVRDWWAKDWFPEKDASKAIPPQLPTPVTADAQAKAPPPALPGTDSSISKTPQALVLVSTTRGRNAREGTARLGTHPENPQTYAAGALLVNGSRLLEIYDDHVVLERNGKQAKLYLASSGKKSDNALLMVGGESSQSKPLVPVQTEILTDYIRPSPVYDGPTIKGYQVYAGSKSGVFSQLGLQNGDLILSLNDQPFVDPQQSIDLFRQLTLGVAMSATVERKGKRERLSLDGALITRDQERAKQMAMTPPAAPMGPMP